MDYKTSQKLFSVARTNKYTYACANNKRKAMLLYRYNIRLCQRFYGVLNLFEVILRNAINEHYSTYYNDRDWIVNQAAIGKLLQEDRDDAEGNVGTSFARQHYDLIREYIAYFGVKPDDVLEWAERPDELLNKIDTI